MQPRINRHLGGLLDTPSDEGVALAPLRPGSGMPPELNGTEWARFLLYSAAGIEHALMVQYLFAAYSLGGPDVPEARRDAVRRWQEDVLGIAKEEMAHMITVQNLLTLLGGPLNFDREDYPFDSGFYPFPFRLEGASPASIAAYVCAESPATWSGPEADAIRGAAHAGGAAPINSVGILYDELLKVVADETVVPDDAFHADSERFQASWSEWGRGYEDGARGTAPGGALHVPVPELLILTATNRETAVTALQQVGDQGEGAEQPEAVEESHFERFREIYRAMTDPAIGDPDRLRRDVGANPTPDEAPPGSTAITHPVARQWAHLFNLRYRMLLIDITHAYELTGGAEEPVNPRGAMINRAFGEMYNLRAIAGQLVVLPAGTDPSGKCAGPPFDMPYTLKLPASQRARWRLHRDLVDTSLRLGEALRQDVTGSGEAYLVALAEVDRRDREDLDLLVTRAQA
ncbi:MAG: ferritin-like protein [Chloroflexi bacterium]|nr:ferritin-like protein [Chloroflexota bacterium]